MKNKRNVRAVVEIENKIDDIDCEFNYQINWIDPNGSSFYRKKFEISPDDSITTLKSSISISPGKRPPGIYTFQISLFGKVLTEKKFELHNSK